MTTASARRTLAVFVPGWILDDRSLAPPAVGDLVETPLTFGESETPPQSYAQTFRTIARPAYGRMPGGDPENGPRWLHELSGDGWAANWWANRPTTGRIEVHGTLFADLTMGTDSPPPVRGRVRRVQVVSRRFDRSPSGARRVAGTERLTEVDTTPHIFWSSQEPRTDDAYARTGVLLDLDLDDVPTTDSPFVAGAVSVDGTDVWVMDRADPVLLHVATAATPPRVVEYLLPLTAEQPRDIRTRAVHADRDGCWITSGHDVFRCDREDDGSLSVERVCTEGGQSIVDEGRSTSTARPNRGCTSTTDTGWCGSTRRRIPSARSTTRVDWSRSTTRPPSRGCGPPLVEPTSIAAPTARNGSPTASSPPDPRAVQANRWTSPPAPAATSAGSNPIRSPTPPTGPSLHTGRYAPADG
ncbi:DUF6578 domain-containing protein [Rhodococcus sp. PAM 2766]|uniref:DUF6578 domain-containing protein n=2 Tax=Rhodococcus parequi TaxID=3137122 RepID=A0ABW9FII4_9NOCA